MGWNTTVVVMNDAIDAIRDDPKFGERLYRAVLEVQRGRPVDVAAHGAGRIHCNAATVIETHHADHTVYVGIGQNYGTPVTDDQDRALRRATLRSSKVIAKGKIVSASKPSPASESA